MTAKQKVKRRFPRAEVDRDGYVPRFGFFDVAIFTNPESKLVRGHGDTPRAAWADAARRLRL